MEICPFYWAIVTSPQVTIHYYKYLIVNFHLIWQGRFSPRLVPVIPKINVPPLDRVYHTPAERCVHRYFLQCREYRCWAVLWTLNTYIHNCNILWQEGFGVGCYIMQKLLLTQCRLIRIQVLRRNGSQYFPWLWKMCKWKLVKEKPKNALVRMQHVRILPELKFLQKLRQLKGLI